MSSPPDETLLIERDQPRFLPLAILALAATAGVSFSPVFNWLALIAVIVAVFIGTFLTFRQHRFGVNRRRSQRNHSRLLMIGFFAFSTSSLWLFLLQPTPAPLFILGVTVTLIPYTIFAFAVGDRSE